MLSIRLQSCYLRTHVAPLSSRPLGALPQFTSSRTTPLTRRFFHIHRTCLTESNDHTKPPAQSSLKRTPKLPETIRENIYTLPNLLTLSRVLACPVLGYYIVQDNFVVATSLLVYAGLTDLVDGWLARKFNMRSVLGTILDPAADKMLMTTLTVTLAAKSLIPFPLAIIILGRDVLLSLSAFYIRYTTLPAPKTFSKYWDFSIPSAEVRPTQISKVNTALQLLLMGTTTISPLLPMDIGLGLQALQWTVGATTIWSGISYLFAKEAVHVISRPAQKSDSGHPPQS